MLGVILRRRYVFLAYIQGGGFTWSEVYGVDIFGGAYIRNRYFVVPVVLLWRTPNLQ